MEQRGERWHWLSIILCDVQLFSTRFCFVRRVLFLDITVVWQTRVDVKSENECCDLFLRISSSHLYSFDLSQNDICFRLGLFSSRFGWRHLVIWNKKTIAFRLMIMSHLRQTELQMCKIGWWWHDYVIDTGECSLSVKYRRLHMVHDMYRRDEFDEFV